MALALLSTGATSGDDPSRVTAHRVRHLEDYVLNYPGDIDPIFSIGFTSIDPLKTSFVKEKPTAKSNRTPCFAKFASALAWSHSKAVGRSMGQYTGYPPGQARNRKDPELSDL